MMIFRKNVLYIYSDGSSMSKPRRGGIGVRYIYLRPDESEVKIDLNQDGYQGATNNQMELKAVIEGLKASISQPIEMSKYSIEVRTDSRYVTDNVNNAIYNWQKHKWRNQYGKPIENAELWKDLIKAIKAVSCHVNFNWVKGHAKDADNKAVDRLAKQSSKTFLKPPITTVKLRKKKFPHKTVVGSIKMLNQRVLIYIVSDSYMRLPKKSKYRIQVMSKMSPFYKNIDFVYSSLHQLKSGHYYAVRLNGNNQNPEIVEEYKELTTKLKTPPKSILE